MYYAAQDIIEYLMNSVGGGSQDSEHRLLRSAAHNAYRDLLNAREWNWLNAEMPLPAAVSGSSNKVFMLPDTVKTVDALIPPDRTTGVAYVTPSEWRRLEANNVSVGTMAHWTAVRSPTRPDRWQIMVAGTPSPLDPTKTYYITYRRAPAPLRYMGFEPASRDGSLTASNAPGAVKRYGTATNHPEGASGMYPFTAEEILGLSGSMSGTPPTGAKTVVSDYLDVSSAMFTALLSGAEVWLAKLMGKNVDGATAVYARDLRLAFEADVVAPISGRRISIGRYPELSNIAWGTPRALGYYSASAPDTGA